MSKLKTFKDFEEFILESLDPRIDPEIWEGLKNIRTEAVKRWKRYKKMKKLYPENSKQYEGAMFEIEEFNNLTEEDLK